MARAVHIWIFVDFSYCTFSVPSAKERTYAYKKCSRLQGIILVHITALCKLQMCMCAIVIINMTTYIYYIRITLVHHEELDTM